MILKFGRSALELTKLNGTPTTGSFSTVHTL